MQNNPRRLFPIQATIDLNAIESMDDLDAITARLAASAKNAIFREMIKGPQAQAIPGSTPDNPNLMVAEEPNKA